MNDNPTRAQDWPMLRIPDKASPAQMKRAFIGSLLLRQRKALANTGSRQERQEAAAVAHELGLLASYWHMADIVEGEAQELAEIKMGDKK